MDQSRSAVERVRPILQAMERSIEAARRRRLHESQAVPPPLEACIDDFWRSGPRLAELKRTPPAAHASHALLRRLGPSPLGGKFPLVGLLASIYDAVAKSALRMRNQD